MASTYTANLGIEKIGSGEQAGTWGTTTNLNLDIIDRAINGVVAISLSSTSHTLTTTDGALSEGGHKLLNLSGSPGGTCTVTISPNDQDKVYFVKNGTDQTVTFTQGSGANASVSSGGNAIIFADGAGSGAAVAELTLSTGQGQDLGSASAEIGNIFIADDKAIKFGSDQDVVVEYDEDGTDSLLISGGDVTIADDKKLNFGTGKDVSLEYDEDGTDTLLISGGDVRIADDEEGTDTLLITGAVTFADGSTAVNIASHDTSNGLKLGGTLVSSTAAELNLLDGSSAGTIANSKGVIYGSSGEVNATTLQIGGTSITATAAELNIMDGVTATASELNIMDGVTATTAELNHTDGVTSNIQTQLDAKVGTTSHDAVGSYAILLFQTSSTNSINIGETASHGGTVGAGTATLQFASFFSQHKAGTTTSRANIKDTDFTKGGVRIMTLNNPTGTWRCLGPTSVDAGDSNSGAAGHSIGLWVRTA